MSVIYADDFIKLADKKWRLIYSGWRLEVKIDLLLKKHWPWPCYGGGRSLEVIYTENAFGTTNGDRWVEVAIQTGDRPRKVILWEYIFFKYSYVILKYNYVLIIFSLMINLSSPSCKTLVYNLNEY